MVGTSYQFTLLVQFCSEMGVVIFPPIDGLAGNAYRLCRLLVGFALYQDIDGVELLYRQIADPRLL